MDQIANMLIMIKNASNASHEVVVFPYSKIKHAIATCLVNAGYIAAVTKKTRNDHPVLEVSLIYTDGSPRIHDLKRVSKPSRRVYFGVHDLRPIKNGRGLTVLSTPKGILTDKEAKKELVGGEALFSIW